MKTINDICATEGLNVQSATEFYAMGHLVNDWDEKTAFVAIGPDSGIGYGRTTIVTGKLLGTEQVDQLIKLFFEPGSNVMLIDYQTPNGLNVYDLWDVNGSEAEG